MKQYTKLESVHSFLVGSQLYGLINTLSDYDYLYLVENINTLSSDKLDIILSNKDIELKSFQQFKDDLYRHDLKCLEVYFNYYNQIISIFPDLIYGKGFIIVNDALRRSVSSVASNSNVKAKKKIAQGDVYVGRKSFYHSYRILYMYTKLIDNSLSPVVYLNSNPIVNALNYTSDAVQAHLRDVYTDIVLSQQEDLTTLYPRLKAKYDAPMKELIHTLRINCPLDKDKNKEQK